MGPQISDLPAIVAPGVPGEPAGEPIGPTPLEPEVTSPISGSPLGGRCSRRGIVHQVEEESCRFVAPLRRATRSGHHGQSLRSELTGGTHTRVAALRLVAAFPRTRWPESIGMGGRFPSDQAAGIAGTTSWARTWLPRSSFGPCAGIGCTGRLPMLMIFPNRRNPDGSPRRGRQEESLLRSGFRGKHLPSLGAEKGRARS